MGKQEECRYCKNQIFKIYSDVFHNDLITKPHIEFVCAKCGRGIVLELKGRWGEI